MPTLARFFLLFSVNFTAFQIPVAAQPDPNLFSDFSTPGLPGRLFVPPQAATSDRPVIVFFHGSAEIGTNNTAQINSNITNLFAEAQARGAFLYVPQAIDFGWTGIERTNLVISMVNQLLATQNANSQRVYATGLSMGGGGAWTIGDRYTRKFAATVPIAGLGPASDFNPANMIGLPTWVFHARNDANVPHDVSQDLVNDVLAAAGEPTIDFPADNSPSDFEFQSSAFDLRYTEYGTGGHGIWPRVYNSDAMYDWLFSQTLPAQGDFNADDQLDVADLDTLVSMIVSASDPELFDLNFDGRVDLADQNEWLNIAGATNLGSGRAYLPGDANLDGSVDGADFLIWNEHKFTTPSSWSTGDFNATGHIDGQDFLLWNDHKFTGARPVSALPEPALPTFVFVILAVIFRRQHTPVMLH